MGKGLAAFRCIRWATLLVLAGCATTRPTSALPPPATDDASWRAAEPAGTVHYRLAMGEVSSGGKPFERPAPVYPSGPLASCPPPQGALAVLVVDEAGKVSEVRVAGEVQAGASMHAFIAAVRAAALQWQFNPLLINHWAADAGGNSHVVDSETKPFSLAYVFRFECHAGKSTVSAAQAKS
jgi:hypothetical protein